MEEPNGPYQDAMNYMGGNQREGLSSDEAARRLLFYGPNITILPEEEDVESNRFMTLVRSWMKWDLMIPAYKIMIRAMLNPVSWISLLAALVSLIMFATVGTKLYLFEGILVLSLLLCNFFTCFSAARRAETANRYLLEGLTPKTKVLRDGIWRLEDQANLVPGDIIFLKWGDIVPAHVRLLVDNSVTTTLGMYSRGVRDGSIVYCGSSLFFGEGIGVVIATGCNIRNEHIKCSYIDFERSGQIRKGAASAGIFCFSLIILATLIELVVTVASKFRSEAMLHNHFFILLLGGIPFAMPAVFYLALALGSHRLSRLGVALRGTVGLENLATIDVFSFNTTGTLTQNKLKVERSMIHVLHKDMKVEDVIHIAARTCFKRCELYQEALDTAIVDLLSNPDAANIDIEEEAGYFPYNFYSKFCSRWYRAKDGLYYSAIKGDPHEVMPRCELPIELHKSIDKKIDELGRDGYQVLAIAQQEFTEEPSVLGPAWKLVALMPFRDDLRKDSVEAINSLTDMSLHALILTGGSKAITKEICRRFGMLEVAVHDFEEMDCKDISKANAIFNAYPDSKNYVINNLMIDHQCAMVGGGMCDTLALEDCDLGISGPDASDKARSLSDLILTKPSLTPLVKSIQISRDISESMKSYLIFAIASTIHAFGVLLISMMWRLNFSCFLALLMAVFNYGMAFSFIGETAVQGKSLLRWRVKRMIATGVCFGCYVTLTTSMFFMGSRNSSLLHNVYGARSIRLDDDTMRAALFLQMSIVNQAIVFFTTDHIGTTITCTFSVSQMVATLIAVYADMEFAKVRHINWAFAGVIWIYNCLLLLVLRLLKQYGPKALSWFEMRCMHYDLLSRLAKAIF